jgi:hypothetical protein
MHWQLSTAMHSSSYWCYLILAGMVGETRYFPAQGIGQEQLQTVGQDQSQSGYLWRNRILLAKQLLPGAVTVPEGDHRMLETVATGLGPAITGN